MKSLMCDMCLYDFHDEMNMNIGDGGEVVYSWNP